MKSKQRHSGGAYRRMKTMKSMYIKLGKDREKSKLRSVPEPNEKSITPKQTNEISNYIEELLKQKAGKKHGRMDKCI